MDYSHSFHNFYQKKNVLALQFTTYSQTLNVLFCTKAVFQKHGLKYLQGTY